jgi:hypothetical protein
LIVNTEGSWKYNFGGSFRVVYQLPPQKLAASERVGGLCRYSISYACSGIGNVGSFTEMQGNGLLKSTRKVLDSTTLVDPFG